MSGSEFGLHAQRIEASCLSVGKPNFSSSDDSCIPEVKGNAVMQAMERNNDDNIMSNNNFIKNDNIDAVSNCITGLIWFGNKTSAHIFREKNFACMKY